MGRLDFKHRWNNGSLTYSVVNPGSEINVIGFETRVDFQAILYLVRYREKSPSGSFQFYIFKVKSDGISAVISTDYLVQNQHPYFD